MKKKVEEMIKEYKAKVKTQDILLRAVDKTIKEGRRKEEACEDERAERKVIQGRRAAYLQAMYDFKSIIGEW